MKTLGLDGCRAGWIAISLDGDGAGYWLLESDAALGKFFQEYDRIFIDVPIGLPDETSVRTCDEELRRLLGPEYRASVFNPPVRPALHAPTYAEASVVSYEITGKKISIQSWNITPAIRSVDRLLQEEESLRGNIFESHPEFLFRKLNGGSSILQKKQTKRGLRHRLGLLENESEFVDPYFRQIKDEYRRNQVEEDDIIDSMVLALFARRSLEQPIRTLPEDPPVDSTGLKMAIHYV